MQGHRHRSIPVLCIAAWMSACASVPAATPAAQEIVPPFCLSASILDDFRSRRAADPDLSLGVFSLERVRDFVDRITDLDEVLRRKPNDFFGRFNRGITRAAQGDPAGAVEDFDEAARVNPREPLVYLNRGIIRGALGDGSGWEEDWRKALELAPPDWPQRTEIERWFQEFERRR